MPAKVTFKFGGERKQVSLEEAKDGSQRLEALLADSSKVVTVMDLSCRQWTVETIGEMRPALKKAAKTLEYLNVDDTIAGLQTDIGLAIMELWAQIFDGATQTLQKITLNDNAMGPRALERMRTLLRSPNLHTLKLNNCGLSAETIPVLDAALKMSDDELGVPRLRSLSLDRNMIGEEGARQVGLVLRDCVDMTAFSYAGCRPGDGGTKYITKALRTLAEKGNAKLSDLNLHDCSFGTGEEDDDAIHDLKAALENLRQLKKLSLQDGGDFGEDGTGLICGALKNSGSPLVDLDMSGCGVGPGGAAALRELLEEKRGTLKKLKLDTNELEDDGVECIIASFEGGDNVLDELRLDENELGSLKAFMAAKLPELRLLSVKENMELEELEDFDEQKQKLRDNFPKAVVLIDDDDEEPTVQEQEDAEVDALADALAAL